MGSFKYIIKTYTGTGDFAGTDSSVSVRLIGSKDYLRDYVKLDMPGEDDFESGSVGLYSVETETDLGEIREIDVKFEATGEDSDWFLEGITVSCIAPIKGTWYFPAGEWMVGNSKLHLEMKERRLGFTYLADVPEMLPAGANETLKGLCRNEESWFFAQGETIYKVSENFYGEEELVLTRDCPGISGDIDVCGEYLFVPVMGENGAAVRVYAAGDLHFFKEQTITRGGAAFKSLPWLAVNPRNKYLYTSEADIGEEFGEDSSPIVVYSVDYESIERGGEDFLDELAAVAVYFEDGEDLGSLSYRSVRGGCFDKLNNLQVAAFSEMKEDGETNERGVIATLAMPEYIVKGGSYLAERKARSVSEGNFCFVLKENEEPAGLVYWDCEEGQLHVPIVCREEGGKSARLLHYRAENLFPAQRAMRRAFLITVTNGEKISRSAGDESFAAECSRRRESRTAVRRALEMWGIESSEFENRPFLELKNRISEICADANGDSETFFYIGCHGNTAGLWLDYEEDGTSKVDWEELQGLFSSLPGRKVIFMDACHSGSGVVKSMRSLLKSAGSKTPEETLNEDVSAIMGLFSGRYKGGPGGFRKVPRKLEKMQHPDNFVICSCSMEERSWNYEGHSLFSEWLALGLGSDGVLTADRDLDEMLTLKELYLYVKENVARVSEEKNREWAATGASYVQTVQCYPAEASAFAGAVILRR